MATFSEASSSDEGVRLPYDERLHRPRESTFRAALAEHGVAVTVLDPPRVVGAAEAPEAGAAPALGGDVDDAQARDWHFRGDGAGGARVDAAAERRGLWRDPAVAGSAGAAPCGPCACGAASCRESAGATVHEAVLCWRCKRSFCGDHVAGFLQVVAVSHVASMAAVPELDLAATARRMVLGWGACPRCGAQLGAASAPTAFARLFGT